MSRTCLIHDLKKFVPNLQYETGCTFYSIVQQKYVPGRFFPVPGIVPVAVLKNP
jgi:hypothetical protein